MTADRFAQFTDGERALLFEALLFCIESNSGIGFRGNCQSRIEYQAGATGADITATEDAETHNKLFHFFQELSLHLSDSPEYKLWHRRYGITDWREFCRKAVAAAEKRKNDYTTLNERDGYYGSAS